MKKSQIIVAYVCDEKYIPYLKISMDSVKRYNKNVRFVVLSRQVFQLSGAEVYYLLHRKRIPHCKTLYRFRYH